MLYKLSNIPSCKQNTAVVVYRYKDSSSQEETDEKLSKIYLPFLYKICTINKMNVPEEFKFRQKKVSSDSVESEVNQ